MLTEKGIQEQKKLEYFRKVEEILSRIEEDLPAPKFYGLDNNPAHDEVNGIINQDITFICERWDRIGGVFDNCGVHLFAKGKDLATITKKHYGTMLIDDNAGQASFTHCDTTNFSVTSAAWYKHPDLVTTITVTQENKDDNGELAPSKVAQKIDVHHAKDETAEGVVDKIYNAVVLGKHLTPDKVKKLSKLNIATKILGLINQDWLRNFGREM